MLPAGPRIDSLLQVMLFTGIILAPAAIATPALQDFIDMRTVVNAAANTIGDLSNPNRGWGFNLGGSGQLGTADLVNNVTTTILRSKWQLDTNKTMWLTPANLTNETNSTPNILPPALTPTLPLSSSLAQPSTLPTTTPTLNTTTTDLSAPYTDYVSAIPNLATSLTSLGRVYHHEMNTPVYQAIAGLQQSLSALQSAMLQNNLIRPNAVVRTLRASSSLEDAQQSWSRFLNLPGTAGTSTSDLGGTTDTSPGTSISGPDDTTQHARTKRASIPAQNRPPLRPGEFYTHQDLWGRRIQQARHALRAVVSKRYEPLAAWDEQHAKEERKQKRARAFVA